MPTLTLGIGASAADIEDYAAYWIYQTYTPRVVNGNIALAADVLDTDTSILVTGLTPTDGDWPNTVWDMYRVNWAELTNSKATALNPPKPSIEVGSSVLIGQEAMTVTSVTPTMDGKFTLAVSRGTTQTVGSETRELPLAIASAHAEGAIVGILRYTTPWWMIYREALVPHSRLVKAFRGPDSANYTTVNVTAALS